MIALTTSRMLTSRRRPPGFAGGMSGSTIAHCSSVRSVAYAIRVGCMCTLPCTRKGASCSKLGIQGKPAFRIASYWRRILKLKERKTKHGRRRIRLTRATLAALEEHQERMKAEGHGAGPVFCNTEGG